MILSALRVDYDWSTSPSIVRSILDSIPRASYICITLTITMGKVAILTFAGMTADECFEQINTYHDLYLNRVGRRIESALG
jgi:hypothetical protein